MWDIVCYALSVAHCWQRPPWPLLPAPAQQSSGSTVKTNVEEVLLDLIVRDKKGKPVTDLKPEDLNVFDDGTNRHSPPSAW